MKILINTPDLSKHNGGVANHYIGLQPYWTQKVKYNFVGGRNGVPGPIILVFDYIKFFFLCLFGNYDVVLLNPSLGKTALKRDALFLKISKWFKIKTVVFFHGWNQAIAAEIDDNPKQFQKQFQKADTFIILASSFKNRLLSWGISSPIYMSTTKINDELLDRFNIDNKPFDKSLLFLARIEKNKGVFTTLNAFKVVLRVFPDAQLQIAGYGTALEKAKEYAHKQNIKNVSFLGSIKGNTLVNKFVHSSIYILPTTHGEGMPTSVLEAMAFGLPIISRPVGGLVDFFEEDKMGYLIESLDPKVYAEKIIQLLENPEKIKEIGKYNHEYAKRNFIASKVALRLEQIITSEL
nr:glycosyltransferase family 4 protein [uncultured Brumimicrobium sp.]